MFWESQPTGASSRFNFPIFPWSQETWPETWGEERGMRQCLLDHGPALCSHCHRPGHLAPNLVSWAPRLQQLLHFSPFSFFHLNTWGIILLTMQILVSATRCMSHLNSLCTILCPLQLKYNIVLTHYTIPICLLCRIQSDLVSLCIAPEIYRTDNSTVHFR